MVAADIPGLRRTVTDQYMPADPGPRREAAPADRSGSDLVKWATREGARRSEGVPARFDARPRAPRTGRPAKHPEPSPRRADGEQPVGGGRDRGRLPGPGARAVAGGAGRRRLLGPVVRAVPGARAATRADGRGGRR